MKLINKEPTPEMLAIISNEKEVFDSQVGAEVERTLERIRVVFGEAVGKTKVIPGDKQ